MKREKTTYPVVREFKPLLFWYKCRFCNKEFRREKGFKIIDLKQCRSSNSSPIYESYSCKECAKNISEVKYLIDKEKIVFKRPPKPGNKVTKKKEEITDCFYCKDKWKCYDRFFEGRIRPCAPDERKINLKKYKEWELELSNK